MNKVAVITRTKDRPVFLRRAIRSIVDQTFQDYTHVIVNDGGDRGVLEKLLDEFDESVRANIQVFHRDTSSEAPDTIFNESIDRVDSTYFALHDDDDTWHPNFLEASTAHLEANNELGAVVARTDRIDEEQSDSGAIMELKRSHFLPDLKVINLYRQCIDNQLTPISTLYKRSSYNAVGKFDNSLPVVGDWEFGIRLLQKYDVDFIDPGHSLAYYHHRKPKSNSSGNTSFAGNEKHRYFVNKVMNKYLRNELAEGRLGVGYIMSQLKYDQGQMARLAQSVMPRFVSDKLKNRFRD